MSQLILEPSATAAWQRLITDAAETAGHELDEQRESYLVFLLMRYLRRSEMVKAVLALQFLRMLNAPRRQRQQGLQQVGDQCLILAGLFPEQADRRRVQLSYFVDLGQSAYDGVARDASTATAQLFDALAETFVGLMDVLQAVRQSGGEPLMNAMEAAERSLSTGSSLARRTLRELTDATPIPPGSRAH
ncbi:MAG: hypothetical protein PVH31_01230 [Ectothiorhodospiraceae bacterium]|jgi:hypothetical protein